MRPIPKTRLKQSVIYQQFDDSGHDNSYGSPVTVSFVCVQEDAQLIRDNNGNIIKSTTLLIYDNVTSSPRDIIFAQQDKVTINQGKRNEKTLKVVSAPGGAMPHHQEVILQ